MTLMGILSTVKGPTGRSVLSRGFHMGGGAGCPLESPCSEMHLQAGGHSEVVKVPAWPPRALGSIPDEKNVLPVTPKDKS